MKMDDSLLTWVKMIIQMMLQETYLLRFVHIVDYVDEMMIVVVGIDLVVMASELIDHIVIVGLDYGQIDGIVEVEIDLQRIVGVVIDDDNCCCQLQYYHNYCYIFEKWVVVDLIVLDIIIIVWI